MRDFEKWWNRSTKQTPSLEKVNYVWLSEIINRETDHPPSPDEVLEWITSGKVEAKTN